MLARRTPRPTLAAVLDAVGNIAMPAFWTQHLVACARAGIGLQAILRVEANISDWSMKNGCLQTLQDEWMYSSTSAVVLDGWSSSTNSSPLIATGCRIRAVQPQQIGHLPTSRALANGLPVSSR